MSHRAPVPSQLHWPAPAAARQERGLRRSLPRRAHAAWQPGPDRPDPVSAVLAANTDRLPELRPLKFGRMAASPFGFFRGAVGLMAADLAGSPHTGLWVQLCGDAHLRNLGAFAAPDGHLVFDLNDFDETLPGPWEWDLKRLATSVVLAGRDHAARGRALTPGETRVAVLGLVRRYRQAMARFATMPRLALYRYEVRLENTPPGPVRALLEKAQRATPERNLQKLTLPGPDGRPRFHDQPPLWRHLAAPEVAEVLAALVPYRETLGAGHQLALDGYHPCDVAFKVVGTGSVGTRDYVVLLFGRNEGDPLFLQVKEETASAYAPYLPAPAGLDTLHQGRRVAAGQARLQTTTDPFVGWTTVRGRDYLVRQLADHKAALDPTTLRATELGAYAEACGEVLAKAHARTGDPGAIAGYCGRSDRLDRALAGFAAGYADQTERDHAAFVVAVQAGRVPAVAG